tara:strand:+ start:52 stop:267 length:216 start_codon:yes stop_codon:yes gene_type:complete
MDIEQLEQLAAVIVTAGLVAGNFLLFTPWRNGEDPRQRHPQSLIQQRGVVDRPVKTPLQRGLTSTKILFRC